jgi:6-pyruvoyltetrahydropterin/6-carboxytetrahydropterin synthase
MFRLTREVRFAINDGAEAEPGGEIHNGYGGFPPSSGLARYFAIQLTLSGDLGVSTHYLQDIKQIDLHVRRRAIPLLAKRIADGQTAAAPAVAAVYAALQNAWAPAVVDQIKLLLSPRLSVGARASEFPMIRLSEKFEFCAAHRLHNPGLSDQQNRQLFGKCNNAGGHGHNYELQVTLTGLPDASGLVMDIPSFERLVATTVIDRFDHKNLNTEVAEFTELMPTVENIAKVIYGLLKPKFTGQRAKLASVTVWETGKTWCEYAE